MRSYVVTLTTKILNNEVIRNYQFFDKIIVTILLKRQNEKYSTYHSTPVTGFRFTDTTSITHGNNVNV
jgi:hypothetical protein